MTTEITSIQSQIYAQNEVPHLTSSNIEKIKYPFTGSISTTTTLSAKLEKIKILKSLFANRNGLEATILAINAAISSTSTSGATGLFPFRQIFILIFFYLPRLNCYKQGEFY